jgi:hypothetical protein
MHHAASLLAAAGGWLLTAANHTGSLRLRAERSLNP